MIRVLCPHCQRSFRTKMEGMGKTAVCSGCHQAFRIGEARPAFEWKPAGLAEDSWVGVEPPGEEAERKHCVMCQAAMPEDAVLCPACGVNQVTGLVARARRKTVPAVKPPWWTLLPLRTIIGVALLLGMGLAVYIGFHALTRSVAESSQDAADLALLQSVADKLSQAGEADELRDEYGGRVDDESLPRFIRMLSAENVRYRKAAQHLIAWGSFTRLDPILDTVDNPATAETATEVLREIGPRRLLRLAESKDTQARRCAIRGLCLVLGLPLTPQADDRLAQAQSSAELISELNALTRPYPEAVGEFVVVIEETVSDFTVCVSQIGTVFALDVGGDEYWSSATDERSFAVFEMAIERWCAATGTAVAPAAIRNLASGSLRLTSPHGVGWQGSVRMTSKRLLTKPLPGFLPVRPGSPGERVEVPVLLRRPTP